MSEVTTPFAPPGGKPFPPPTRSTPLADFVPFLPPVQRAEPVPEKPVVFDAKMMVDATKRKIEHPVYGMMPTGTEEGRAAIQLARTAMKRRRARNNLIARAVAVVVLGGIAAAGWFGYQAYRDDQDRQKAERAANAEGEAPGAATALGEQAQVIDVMEDLNSGGAAPSAGALLGAVDDAQAVVGETNNPGAQAQTIKVTDVLPLAANTATTPTGTADGLDLFQIDAEQFQLLAPEEFALWTARWTSAPQTTPADPALAALPAVDNGQIAIGMMVDGGVVTRLLIASTAPAIHIVIDS
jgi:type II secretory pathway pseudopilin PulG